MYKQDIQNQKDVGESDSSCVWRKKSGELWSTNYKELHVSLDPLKCTVEDYISAFRGRDALKFLHALKIDQDLLAHTPRGRPPQKNNREHLNVGLKFSV